MNIQLNKIKLHNFMSFTDSIIDLTIPGYTLISGENNNIEDNSSSNGSGKSSIYEAIIWCLTGETQRGVKNVKKLNTKECNTTLWFSVDKDNYEITRSIIDKSNFLQIIKNKEDISGKGIRDSEKILNEQLPDITMSLLSNIVILGQGLPNRFSLESPSGRKEALEKLFKADFMIEDIKNRINDRLNILKDEQRNIEDTLLSLNTKKDIANQEIIDNKEILESMFSISTLKTQYEELNDEIINLQTQLDNINNSNKKINEDNNKINQQIIELTEKQIEINNSNYLVKEIEDIKNKGTTLKGEVIALDKEIERKDNITDICPTCGQKLVGVEKPDTTKEKEQSMKIKKELDALREQVKDLQQKRQDKLDKELKEINNEISNLKSQLKNTQDISNIEFDIKNKISVKDRTKEEISNHSNQVKNLNDIIKKNKKIIDDIEKQLNAISIEKVKLDSKIEVDNKINSIIKRDFRGYLLSNVISLIDKSFKEYGQELYGHTNMSISQDGNNISIKLNDKEYELLSGGEKQKIDLCCQFAIRDILIRYNGFNTNLIVLDEIFDNLDDVGAEKILNLVTNKLNIPSIHIITHHADISIPADNRIIVKKNNTGSIALQI